MEEVRNRSGKLVCQIDRSCKTVEIVLKGCVTRIRFTDDGNVEIINTERAA